MITNISIESLCQLMSMPSITQRLSSLSFFFFSLFIYTVLQCQGFLRWHVNNHNHWPTIPIPLIWSLIRTKFSLPKFNSCRANLIRFFPLACSVVHARHVLRLYHDTSKNWIWKFDESSNSIIEYVGWCQATRHSLMLELQLEQMC